MSFSYDRYDRRRQNNHSAFGFWVPLVLTVTVAGAGLAAWAWKEHRDDEVSSTSDDENLSYGDAGEHDRPPQPPRPGTDQYNAAYGAASGVEARGAQEDGSIMSRVSGAIRRSPSPQQVFDSASRKVAAGVAAAGALATGALASIREEGRDDYGDHSRWSEEATLRRNVEAQSTESHDAVASHTEAFSSSMKATKSSGRRKTVAIVVSAESSLNAFQDERNTYSEQVSILSHLPPTNFGTTNLLVLIYAPSLASRAVSTAAPPSLGSSYDAISTPGQTPGEELTSLDPNPHSDTPHSATSGRDSNSNLYHAMHNEALRVVERPTCVMPFTTVSGFVPMLRHLAPDLVYVVESLSGDRGANIDQLRKWAGQVIVVVGGDGAGLGGLVDTDDEIENKHESEHKMSKWWESDDMVGLGKGVEVVDGARVADDFERRVGGKE